MHFHPKDTYSAFKPADKGKIAHLAYHIDYDQMIEKKSNKGQKGQNGKEHGEKITFTVKPIQSPLTIHRDVIRLIKSVEKQRIRAFAEVLDIYSVRQLEGKLHSRILPGLGAGHVRESSLSIHPVYGIPYIPGSSVKGLVRNWFIHAFCDGMEEKLGEHPFAEAVFGSQKRRGIVQFYDIYLYDGLKIEGDIMAPHFSDYYRGEKPASDQQRVIPISFWAATVDKATVFMTMNKTRLPEGFDEKETMDQILLWTKTALTEFGIGSKTALGYGIFSEVRDVTDQELQKEVKIWKEELKKEAERKKELEIQKMSPEQQLLYRIEQLTDDPDDIERSKTDIFQNVMELKNKEAAERLKVYWEKTGQWKVKKGRKQYHKVKQIKELLDE